jgi:hypothetical protein
MPITGLHQHELAPGWELDDSRTRALIARAGEPRAHLPQDMSSLEIVVGSPSNKVSAIYPQELNVRTVSVWAYDCVFRRGFISGADFDHHRTNLLYLEAGA